MSRLLAFALSAAFAASAGGPVGAQEVKSNARGQPAPDPREPIHDELRAFRAMLLSAVNGKDIDGLLRHVHPNVVVVWHNAEVSRGHAGLRDYYDKVLGRPDAVLDSYVVEVEVPEKTILYGDNTGVVYGTAVSHYRFKTGRTFDVQGPWSAALVKEGGTWQITAFHASVGLFDNPLLSAATTALYWGCGVAGIVGVLVGGFGLWFVRRLRLPRPSL